MKNSLPQVSIPQVVLVHPEIPQNTGNLARCTAANNTRLHLIEPLGFEITEKRVKRAGLDYWPEAQVQTHSDWQSFLKKESVSREQLWIFSTKAKKDFWDVEFKADQYLIFGSEGSGLDQSYHDEYSDRMLRIPISNEKVRSLNLANAVSIAVYESKRQLRI